MEFQPINCMNAEHQGGFSHDREEQTVVGLVLLPARS